MGFAQADVNRDGWPDLVVTIQSPEGTMMQLLINNRDGTFHDQPDAALNTVRTTGGGTTTSHMRSISIRMDGRMSW